MSKPNRHPMSLPSALTEAIAARERLDKYAADCEVTMLCAYPREHSMNNDSAMSRLLAYIENLEEENRILSGDQPMSDQHNFAGAIRTLEAIAAGRGAIVTPAIARALAEYVRGLEKRLEAPLVQGPNNEGSHG